MRQISFRKAVPALLISASALGACTTTSAKPRATVQEAPREVLATPAPEPKRAVQVVAIPEPLPLPGQLKPIGDTARSEEHTSELQSLMRLSYAVFCLKKNRYKTTT